MIREELDPARRLHQVAALPRDRLRVDRARRRFEVRVAEVLHRHLEVPVDAVHVMVQEALPPLSDFRAAYLSAVPEQLDLAAGRLRRGRERCRQ